MGFLANLVRKQGYPAIAIFFVFFVDIGTNNFNQLSRSCSKSQLMEDCPGFKVGMGCLSGLLLVHTNEYHG